MRFSLLVLLSRRIVPGSNFCAAFCSCSSIVLIHLHVLVRDAGGVWLHFRIHRHRGVVFAVHVEIEAEIINMLVGGADNIMVDQRPVAGISLALGRMVFAFTPLTASMPVAPASIPMVPLSWNT